MEIYHCSVCSVEVETYPSVRKKVQHIFCSDTCRFTPFIPKQCTECGKEFLATAQTARNTKFCSKDCRNAKNRREEVHKKTPKTKLICEYCKKEFSVRRSIGKVQRYCSQTCSGRAIGQQQTGENNSKWKPKIKVVCNYCGKNFEIYPCRDSGYKYCCKKHSILGNMQRLSTNPRTNLEIEMSKALQSCQIDFDEQVIRFEKFMVDFKLRKYPIIIQCDGAYWHDRPKVKGRDKGQNNYLAKAGYIVLRFNDTQILDNIQYCIQEIKHAIKPIT